MESDWISYIGLGISICAFVLGIINYISNITLRRKNSKLNEKNILAEKFGKYTQLLQDTNKELFPLIKGIEGYLSIELNDLYRTLSQPNIDTYGTKPIRHRFYNLLSNFSKEIQPNFYYDRFHRSTSKIIRILNIIPSDISDFLKKGKKSSHKTFEYMETKEGIVNYAAVSDVDKSDLEACFKKALSMFKEVDSIIDKSNVNLEKWMQVIDDARINNKMELFELRNVPHIDRKMCLMENTISFVKDKDGLFHYDRDSSVERIIYLATLLEVTKDICSDYTYEFGKDYL